jgi:integrase
MSHPAPRRCSAVGAPLEGELKFWDLKMPKRVAPLNAMQVERIKPGEELIDGSVPGLRVTRTAAGLSWGLSVRVKGARRWIKVGVGIGLAEARRRAERLRQDIAEGKDPAEEHAAIKQRQRDAIKGLGTLRSVTDAYFEHRPELRSAATQRKALMPVFKDYLDKPAVDLTPSLAQLAVDKWARTRSATLASRAVTYFKPLAKWAARRGLMNSGFGELERPAQAAKKQLILSQADVGVLLRSLAGTSRDISIRVMLLTGARCNEVCEATWSEFDLDRGTWTLPGPRRKNPKPGRLPPDHVMPLPAGLVALLRTMGPGAPDKLAFPGARGAVIGNWPKWTRQMKAKLGIDVTPHAFRRSHKTMLGEVGAPPYVGSAALGHAPGDATASAYDKGTYFAERVEYVGRLADRLDALEAGANIISLPRRA